MRRTTWLVLAGLLGSTACQGDRVAGPSPEFVTTAATFSYEWFSAGSYHTCFNRTSTPGSNYVKFCWGLNSSGQVGNNSFTQTILRPTTVTNTTGAMFVLGDGGYGHTCALSNGRAYCWGRNDFGQLGNGNTTNSRVPVQVTGGITWRQVITGWFHTCGINNIGVAYCWGLGTSGQLGHGAATSKIVPTPVSTAIAFGSLTAGEEFTCGWPSTTGGVAVPIYCWGKNVSGQLGVGNNTNLLKPGAAVVGGAKWSYAVAGSTHACATTSAPPGLFVYCWGNNGSTQLGIAETTHRGEYTTPQPVAFGYRMSPIAAGHSHTCGKRDNGLLYCWGRGDRGQLGNGFFVNRPTPYPVYGNFTYQDKLAAGSDHTIAVRSDGAVVTWGFNSSGQLGDGTTFDRGAPVVIATTTQ